MSALVDRLRRAWRELRRPRPIVRTAPGSAPATRLLVGVGKAPAEHGTLGVCAGPAIDALMALLDRDNPAFVAAANRGLELSPAALVVALSTLTSVLVRDADDARFVLRWLSAMHEVSLVPEVGADG